VEGLKGLLDEFSAFARMPESNPTPDGVAATYGGSAKLYRGAHRDIELTLSCDPAVGKVNVDGEQMKRALINLVENAIEAMHGQGRVHIVTSLDGRHSACALKCVTPGRGFRRRSATSCFCPIHDEKGIRLGLAMVNRIVADHGGRISVEITLPRAASSRSSYR
jgi:two-component system nitrogen regulation sensor histidine kinase NtrY